jgi:hypothetical protein
VRPFVFLKENRLSYKVPVFALLTVMALAPRMPVGLAATQDEMVQWMFGAEVPSNHSYRVTNAVVQWKWDHLTGEEFPFTVPPGKCLGLTGAYLSTKHGHNGLQGYERSSYLVLTGVISVPEHEPFWTPAQPILRRSGWTMGGDDAPVSFINNVYAPNEGPQWMSGMITGVLRTCQPFSGYEQYRYVFANWFRGQ